MKIKEICFKTEEDIVKYLYSINVDVAGINIMKSKLGRYNIEIRGIRPAAALILKQELLSVGGELAVPRGFIVSGDQSVTGSVLLMASVKHLNIVIRKLRKQQFGLDILANMLSKQAALNKQIFWRFTDKNLDCKNNFYIMGIINVTPDSFYDGGVYCGSLEAILKHSEKLVNEGADILDIGGESTRPGSKPVEESEELERVIPVISELRKIYPRLPLSIDSSKPAIIKAALESGADIINNISDLNAQPQIADMAVEYKAGLVIMHMKGSPETMQANPEYSNLINEIYDFIDERMNLADKIGVRPEAIAIDPGIGFGKTVAHNLEIIKRLNEFSSLERPVMMGISNKSFIGKALGLDISERVTASSAASVLSFERGASIFRTHNVRETKESLKISDYIIKTGIKQ